MNNMRVLICATFALLVAALVYFYVNSGQQTQSSERSIKELENDLAEAYLNQAPQNPPTTSASIYTAPAPTNTGFEAMNQLTAEEKKAKEEAELSRLADEIERQRLEEEKAKGQDSLIENQLSPVNETRLQWITQASVMAKVIEFDKATLLIAVNIKRPGAVVPDMILGIRRNTEIIGKVKISSIEDGQAFADVIPTSFSGKPVDVNIGDELIITP